MLRITNISKKIKNFSLNNVSFNVEKGDYFILSGISGAGKTMLLEIIAGVVKPDNGEIIFNGRDITNEQIKNRNIGLVYQNQTLFPHMTVYENIAYPLKNKKLKRNEIDLQVKQLATDTEILHLLDRNTINLSGGEVQRVTIARTLATKPECLLLDEPLSFLDVQLKRGISSLLRKLNQKGQTIIHVTHDYEEAIAMANKIAILENGTIIQTGTLEEVFHNPKSEFVANFIGIKNFYKGILLASENDASLKKIKVSGIEINILTEETVGSEGYAIVSGENITVSNNMISSSALNNFEGTVKDIIPAKLGFEIIVNIGIEVYVLITKQSLENLKLEIGKKVWISFKASSVKFIKS